MPSDNTLFGRPCETCRLAVIECECARRILRYSLPKRLHRAPRTPTGLTFLESARYHIDRS